MRVLITGGAGFIGGHLARAFVERGDTVAVLDNFSTGHEQNVPDNAQRFTVDIRDRSGVRAAFDAFRPERVAHLAAQVSVARSVEHPQLDADVNIVGGLNILEASLRAGVEAFAFASSGGTVYGESTGRAMFEKDTLCPMSPYAISKAAFEAHLGTGEFRSDFRVVVLRFANVFGPRQDPRGEAGIVALFASRLLAGQPVTIFAQREVGDRGCVRDYVYVDDVVAATVLGIDGLRGTFNVGSGVGRCTEDVLDVVARAAGVTPTVIRKGPRAGDIRAITLDASKLVAAGWCPSAEHGDFEARVNRTVEWFLDHK